MKNKKLLVVTLISIILSITFISNINYAENEDNMQNTDEEKIFSIAYSSHVQDKAWEKDFSKINGQESGTTGKNLKNEAIKIKLIDAPEDVEVQYQSYIEDEGWEEWKSNGEISGSVGKNKRMEGIKIKLIGTEKYSVEYRTHVQDLAWTEWKRDGDISGAIGRRLKIEAIQIRIVPKDEISVMYQSHVQDIGWQQYFNDGDTSGVVNRGLKVEGIKIELANATNINIAYQTHIQNIGWENTWKTNGMLSGTTGKNLKIEAIKIKLEENYDIDKYSIMYRVFVQGQGWQDWKKDGEIAGTTGQNKRLEAIEIKIVEQNSKEFSIRYRAHVQDIGWQGYRGNGDTAGIEQKGLKIEAMKIIGKNMPEGVSIKYKTHIQDIGWEKEWKSDGEESGTTGRNLKIEAIKIKLEGTEEYSVQYRAYIQGRGWQDWAYDGEESGTTGKNLKLEAIEIKIIPKIGDKIKTYVDTVFPQNIEQGEIKLKGWMMTNIKNAQIQIYINNELYTGQINRTERKDVLEAIKGFGGEENNPKPGYEAILDLSNIPIGENAKLEIKYLDKENNVLHVDTRNSIVRKKIDCRQGVYGKTGLKIANRGGSDLKYFKFGNGENVFFATFAIHGYEDLWDRDGQELINITNQFYNKLVSTKDYDLAEKWTIYIFPGVNLDGITDGTTHNGPGRTTLYSQAPGNKGIDLNRCWQIGRTYESYTDSDRNYNGTAGFQAYEAKALRDFFIQNKSQNGQTVLVDLHGWTQQLIGDAGICSYYEDYFPENNKKSVGRYGTQYMINWARVYLGSTSRAARTALIELPHSGVYGHQSVIDKDFSNRYIQATLNMLKNL